MKEKHIEQLENSVEKRVNLTKGWLPHLRNDWTPTHFFSLSIDGTAYRAPLILFLRSSSSLCGWSLFLNDEKWLKTTTGVGCLSSLFNMRTSNRPQRWRRAQSYRLIRRRTFPPMRLAKNRQPYRAYNSARLHQNEITDKGIKKKDPSLIIDSN